MGTNFDREQINVNINVTLERYQLPRLYALLKYFEHCGKIGHSSQVLVFADGDGAFRPEFKFSVDVGDQQYKEIDINCALADKYDITNPDRTFYVDKYFDLG